MKRALLLISLLILCALSANPAAAALTKVPCGPGLIGFFDRYMEYRPGVWGDCHVVFSPVECYDWMNEDIWIKQEMTLDIDGYCDKLTIIDGTGTYSEIAYPPDTWSLRYNAIYTYPDTTTATSDNIWKFVNGNEVFFRTVWHRQ